MNRLSVENVATYYRLYTIGGRDVTAVGAGGHYEDAIHTDACMSIHGRSSGR
jgi:hypothetical protein